VPLPAGSDRKGHRITGALTDENEWKNPISTSVYIFFGGNGSGFEKYGFENRIGICGHTETDKYGWRTEKLN
jgi:hypothetical protein